MQGRERRGAQFIHGNYVAHVALDMRRAPKMSCTQTTYLPARATGAAYSSASKINIVKFNFTNGIYRNLLSIFTFIARHNVIK